MGKKQNSDFWATIKDARQLVQDQGKKQKKIQKNMPLNMLKGIRKKNISIHKKEVEHKKLSNIQYDSYSKNKDISFIKKKKDKKRKKRNKYIRLF